MTTKKNWQTIILNKRCQLFRFAMNIYMSLKEVPIGVGNQLIKFELNWLAGILLFSNKLDSIEMYIHLSSGECQLISLPKPPPIPLPAPILCSKYWPGNPIPPSPQLNVTHFPNFTCNFCCFHILYITVHTYHFCHLSQAVTCGIFGIEFSISGILTILYSYLAIWYLTNSQNSPVLRFLSNE